MPKIQAQAGSSLADVYDVQGSIAGIDHLDTHELPIVHEMGATVFSERFGTSISRIETGDIAQDTNFDIANSNFAAVPSRILAIVVFSDAAARIQRVTLSPRDPIAGREIPIWHYDGVTNFGTMRMSDDGAAVANFEVLQPVQSQLFLPNFFGGDDQATTVNDLIMRGRTTGFGAGTVFCRALIYLAFARLAGVSSRGLPIPSW